MTQTIEQLTARVRELEQSLWARDRDCDAKNLLISSLEEENARLKAAVEYTETIRVENIAYFEKQLATSQLRETQLREALDKALRALVYASAHVDNACFVKVMMARDAINEAISTPISTEALDAYVAEKVKEAMK